MSESAYGYFRLLATLRGNMGPCVRMLIGGVMRMFGLSFECATALCLAHLVGFGVLG